MTGSLKKSVILAGLDLDLKLSPGQKHLYLRVCPPDGRILLSGPLGVGEKALEDFVKSHREDLLEARQAIRSSKLHQMKKYEEGEVHPLWGRDYPLYLHRSSKEGAFLFEDGIHLYHKDRDREGREKILLDFYREELKKKLPRLAEEAEKRTGLEAGEWRIRKMKTRWGSCNIRDRRIWVNLHLAKYPEICLYGVLVHELVHFLEKNHNRAFYQYMEEFFPDYKKAEALLKE